MTISVADVALFASVLALVASAAAIIRAVLVSRAKRQRLAAAYANAVVRTAAEPERPATRSARLRELGLETLANERPRIARPSAPTSFMPPLPRPPERPVIDEGPSLNVPLAELLVEVTSSDVSPTPAPDPEPFSGGGGGEFGGAGASGGWDAPSNGGSGSGVGSGD